jgi:hypothetical protein
VPVNSAISPHYSHVTQNDIAPERAGALVPLPDSNIIFTALAQLRGVLRYAAMTCILPGIRASKIPGVSIQRTSWPSATSLNVPTHYHRPHVAVHGEERSSSRSYVREVIRNLPDRGALRPETSKHGCPVASLRHSRVRGSRTDAVYPLPPGHDAKPQITATGKATGLFNRASVLNSESWRRSRGSVNLYQDDTLEARLIRRMSRSRLTC